MNPLGKIGPVTKLSTKAFTGLDAVLEAFLKIAGGPRLARLSLAVAAPVRSDDGALLLLARGGVYLAGGMLPRIKPLRP